MIGGHCQEGSVGEKHGPHQHAGRGESREAHRRDLSILARGGLLNLIGAASNGIFGFALIVVVTRGLNRPKAGVFFEAVALFMIASNVGQLGADDGLVRTIPRLRALHRSSDIRPTLAIALWPVVVASTVFGVIVALFAPQLSSVLVHGRRVADAALVPYIRVLAVFIPIAAIEAVAFAATRGFGTMVPSVVVDNIGRAGSRPVLALAVFAAGMGSAALALSWALPSGVAMVLGLAAMYRLLRRAERRDQADSGSRTDSPVLASEFWRFTAPRTFGTAINMFTSWLDTLLIGGLRTTGEAAIYVASTRYLLLGFLVLGAVQLAIGPITSRLLASGHRDRARVAYQTASTWLVLGAWPVYLTLTVFAPLLLRIFGHGYESGATALAILSAAMMFGTATGPCQVVLTMAGKSWWVLVNSSIGLGLNIALNLILIPRLGIEGAAIAWLITIVATNTLTVFQLHRFLQLSPVGRGFWLATAMTGLCYGALGLLVRGVFGATLPSFLVFAVISTIVYGVLLIRFRHRLDLGTLLSSVRRRSRGGATDIDLPSELPTEL
jgi:O-antigen/teichoic acid export membrane protein